MRTAAISLITIALSVISGCFLWKGSVPEPTTQRIRLHGVVDFNKSMVRADSVALIEEAASMLKEHGELRIVVEGHSDSKGSEAYNQQLSLRRAWAVHDYLVRLGVASNRILVVGKGATVPIATNATREGRAQNRRVELVVY
jgi:OOP family OmpA-OmpF porin